MDAQGNVLTNLCRVFLLCLRYPLLQPRLHALQLCADLLKVGKRRFQTRGYDDNLALPDTYIVRIVLDELLALLRVVQHVVEQYRLALHFVKLFRSLCAIVRFVLRFRPGHDLHELLRLNQVLWPTSSDKLL